MNKTVKIIDLLNKIANGEIPKKIKYNNYSLSWDDVDEDYYCEYYDNLFTYLFSHDQTTVVLDYEIEIIEDNKKIEDDFEFTLSDNVWTTKQASELIDNLSKLEKRLVDHINKIEEKLDGKE